MTVKREFGDVDSTDPRDIVLCTQARDRVHPLIHDATGEPAGTAMLWLGERPRAEGEAKLNDEPVTTGWVHEVRARCRLGWRCQLWRPLVLLAPSLWNCNCRCRTLCRWVCLHIIRARVSENW